MVKTNFVTVIIFFLYLIIMPNDGIDEDFFDDLWKNHPQLSTAKSLKKPKLITENHAKKEENFENNENYEQQKATKTIIKSENCFEKEIEDIKPKIQQKIKIEQLEDQTNFLMPKSIKVPKTEFVQFSEEGSFVNQQIDEQTDQNDLHTNHSNFDGDQDSSDTEAEKRQEMEILNKFNATKKELRHKKVYKKMSFFDFENEIAKKLGLNRDKIYQLKNKLGQIQKKRSNNTMHKDTMIELIRKFDQMRKEKIPGFKYDDKKRNEIEYEIAENFGTTRTKIYEWKKQFGLTKALSDKQKLEKIMQFEKIKEQFENIFHFKSNWKIELKIAQKVGIAGESIYRWKRKFGLITQGDR